MKAVRRLLKRCTVRSARLLRAVKVTYLRLSGVRIGSGTMISMHAKVDSRRGEVLIGKNCHITHGCVILSHDYTAGRLGKKGGIPGRTVVGDNVFIGVNSVVLPDVTIGKNSIIGAGSVVTKDIPSGVVVAGNPARVLRTI